MIDTGVEDEATPPRFWEEGFASAAALLAWSETRGIAAFLARLIREKRSGERMRELVRELVRILSLWPRKKKLSARRGRKKKQTITIPFSFPGEQRTEARSLSLSSFSAFSLLLRRENSREEGVHLARTLATKEYKSKSKPAARARAREHQFCPSPPLPLPPSLHFREQKWARS